MKVVVILLVFVSSLSCQDTFSLAINSFESTYNHFIAELNQGVFDTRLAKKLSKQWRSIENSGNWPKYKE